MKMSKRVLRHQCIKTPMGLSDYLPCPLGVRQGCIISPIMFTLFLTDVQNFISLGSHGIDIETIKLFVLLFADDLVIFAETVIELQRMINRLKEYCTIWRLTINILKTKVIVFRNGGPQRNYERWKYGEHVLETVSYYEYLGILFSSRNSWYMSQKTLAYQASKALFAVKSRLRQFGNVHLSVMFKIFDTKILPILLYGSKLWFSHPSRDVEKVHNQFCRIPKLCYKMQRRWVANDTECWLFHIRNLLFSSGFGEAWLNQGVGNKHHF